MTKADTFDAVARLLAYGQGVYEYLQPDTVRPCERRTAPRWRVGKETGQASRIAGRLRVCICKRPESIIHNSQRCHA